MFKAQKSALIIRKSISSSFVRHYKTNQTPWTQEGMRRQSHFRERQAAVEDLSFLVWEKEKLLMRSLENRLHNGASHVDCPKPPEK